MANIDNSVDIKKDSEGKNAEIVYCTYCPSKILSPGTATFVNIDFPLPHILYKRDEKIDKKEPISNYWMVDKITNFENVGVSHKVDNIKYLACADCERGPIGWHDLTTSHSYVALCRVKHQKTT